MTTDAGALHCPNCGGPAGPGDASCRYCHSTLATVSCPSCFALMFEGSIYCPSCGARRARATGAPHTAPCPSCRGVMREVQLGETSLVECENCHAVWVDAATFEQLCANKEAQAAVLHRWADVERAAARVEVHYRACLVCGKLMNRLNFARLSGTVVDVCKGHGTFLDAGELHQIVTFIMDGGLERARERQLDDLKEEEQRLRAAPQTVPGDQALGPVSWSGFDLLSLIEHLAQR